VAEEDIEINVTFTGADQAAGGAARVANSVEAMGDASEAASRQQQLAATQAIAFGQRVAGAANAVQSLVTQLGGQSRTAGLIGATINSTTQFAQLGAALGPGGALVGGIVGALIPAIRELIEAQDAAAVSARNLQHEEELLTERGQRMAEERRQQVQREVESGNILTLSEEEVTRATALAAERRIQIYTDLQRVAGALRRAEEQGMDHTSGRFREWTEQAATLRSELVDVTEQINTLDRVTLNRGRAASSEANETGGGTTPPRRGGGGTTMGQQRQFRGGMNTDITQELDATQQLLARQQEITDDLRARREAVDALAEAEQLRYEQYAANATAEADAAIALAQAQAEAEQIALDATSRAAEKEKELAREHQAAIQENMSSTFSSIIGSMTDVIGQLAEGNATAEEGAQMMLASFLQTLSQMAQVQALAEVARAISSYPDVAGIAAHVAGALAWGAVAVATGVGGAAISSDVSKAQAARQQAEEPASPRTSGTSEGKGGGTTIINFNQPVVTAQGNADLGRMLLGPIGVAQRRYPGSV
jgi:hypothetical protein